MSPAEWVIWLTVNNPAMTILKMSSIFLTKESYQRNGCLNLVGSTREVEPSILGPYLLLAGCWIDLVFLDMNAEPALTINQNRGATHGEAFIIFSKPIPIQRGPQCIFFFPFAWPGCESSMLCCWEMLQRWSYVWSKYGNDNEIIQNWRIFLSLWSGVI